MRKEMRISEALKWASSFLKSKNREESAAEWLMMFRLGMNRPELMMRLGEQLEPTLLEKFLLDIEQHGNGIPVQYITGEQSFYGRSFSVNNEVLIPRPETEELVEEVLKQTATFFEEDMKLRAVDVGTGSGAIAITLDLENKQYDVTAIDIEKKSLELAAQNAEKLKANVRFLHGDLLNPLFSEKEKYDVIVSNPPYIPDDDVLQLDPLVKDYEPVRALAGGKDGYDFYRRFMEEIPKIIALRGLIAFEVGYDQARIVEGMLRESFGEHIQTLIRRDINGKERIVIGLYEKK
jgi:release factor glutamine methyltransferase